MLDGDTAHQCFDALEVAVGDGFTVVEEPMQPIEGDLTIDLLIDGEGARDGLIVGRVQVEGSAVLH